MARLSLLQVGRLVALCESSLPRRGPFLTWDALVLVTFISSVAFGISVHMISAGTLLIEETILSVVAAVLTLVTVPTMYASSRVRASFCSRMDFPGSLWTFVDDGPLSCPTSPSNSSGSVCVTASDSTERDLICA